MKTIQLEKLERIFQVFQDTKKELAYDKATGKWYWYVRCERGNVDAWHGGFATALDAMSDATGPYFDETE